MAGDAQGSGSGPEQQPVSAGQRSVSTAESPAAGRVPAGSAAAVDEVVVAPRKIRRVVIPVAVVLVLVFVVAAVLLRNTPTGVYFRLSDQVSMAGLGVLLAAGALLLLRPRLRAGLAGIEVRNILNTKSFGWDEVVAISFPDGASWARLELPDDEYAPVMAIQSSDGARAVQAMRDLRELRRRVDEHRDRAASDHPDADRAASDRAGSDRAASDGADSDGADSDGAASDSAGSDSAGSDRAASDRAGSDQAD